MAVVTAWPTALDLSHDTGQFEYTQVSSGHEMRVGESLVATAGSLYTASSFVDALDTVRASLLTYVAEQIASDGVLAIYAIDDPTACPFLVVTEQRDPELRTRIHLTEYELIGRFPNLRLSVTVLSQEGFSPNPDLTSSARRIWSRGVV